LCVVAGIEDVGLVASWPRYSGDAKAQPVRSQDVNVEEERLRACARSFPLILFLKKTPQAVFDVYRVLREVLRKKVSGLEYQGKST
jgi:hypothetical protein